MTNSSWPSFKARSPLTVMTDLWVGDAPPAAPGMTPVCARYTRSLESSSNTKLRILSAMSEYLRNSERTKDPPSVSKVSFSTSVLTSNRSLATAGAAGATGAAPAWVAGTGTKASVLPAGAAAAGAAVLVGLGKKVALLPLWICHWSQSNTMEKPKITHKMVRRISFMKFSFQKERKSDGQTAGDVQQEPDRAHPHTKDGSEPSGPR